MNSSKGFTPAIKAFRVCVCMCVYVSMCVCVVIRMCLSLKLHDAGDENVKVDVNKEIQEPSCSSRLEIVVLLQTEKKEIRFIILDIKSA